MPDLPDDKWSNIIYIEQFYVEHDGKPCRLRYNYNAKDNLLFGIGIKGELISRELIWKEKVGKGHNKEHHMIVGKGQATKLRKKATRALEKVRWVYEYEGLKFEVDSFESAILIKLEVEVPSLETEIKMPEFIQKEIICELTGVPGFDNYSIASKEVLEWLI